jgi:hypothetical protein
MATLVGFSVNTRTESKEPILNTFGTNSFRY